MRHVTLWNYFKKGLKYQRDNNLDEKWKMCADFVDGKQWPEPTKKTKNLPRPVINFCDMILNNKKSNILNQNIKILFKPGEMFGPNVDTAMIGSDIFTRFAEIVKEDLGQSDLDDEAQNHAGKYGTYIYHYYWDSEIIGGMQSKYIGGMRGEIINPKNVFFANPRKKDEQKQEYIQIASIEKVKDVKAEAKKNNISTWENIVADHEIEEEEYKDEEVVTVITTYSRKDGRVIWEKSTSTSMVCEATYLNPEINSKINLEKEPTNEINEPDKADIGSFKNEMYPIVVGNHYKVEKSIFGRGEIENIIPNQKALNFNVGLMLLSVQQTAWPKLIAKIGALGKQDITNAPGEILYDYSRENGWGIKNMETPAFNPQAIQLTDKLLELTRTVSGSTEVSTGEVAGANMAASAIIALQNQAKKPIDMLQKSFYRTYKKIAKLYEQFFKMYYTDNRVFSFEEDGQNYAVEMNGKNFENYEFNATVEIGAGGVFSESLTVNLLESLRNRNTIDDDDLIELYPDSAMPFKAQLKKIRERKAKEMMLQQQMLAQQPIGDNPTLPPIENVNNENMRTPI